MRHWLSSRVVYAMCAAFVFSACGGGGSGADGAVSPDTPSTSPSSALVTADIDADGKPDIIRLDRADLDDPACRRTDGDGLVERPDWSDHPVVRSIRGDVRSQADRDLLEDEGVHRARGVVSGARPVPYAVLHVGEDDETPSGPPSIDELLPEEGDAGTLLGIRGTNFKEADTDTVVTVDGVAAELLYVYPRFALAIAPEGTALGDVEVIVTRGVEVSTAATFTVLATPQPTIDAVHPDPLVAGTVALVDGMNLGTPLDEVTVTLGGEDVTRFLPLGRRMGFEVPDTATTGPLVVTVNGVASDPFAITVQADFDAPGITALTPAQASPGSLVKIDGTNLFVIGDRVSVFFGATEAALYAFGRDHVIAVVPASATSSDVTVRVGDRTSSGVAFDVVARGAPSISSLDPLEGAPGERVLIEGTDLYDLSAWEPGRLPPFRDPFGDITVSFGAEDAFFAVPTLDGLRVLVPFRAAPGVVDVTVTVGSETSLPVAFEVK